MDDMPEVLTLSLEPWSDDRRRMPSDIVRSSLFNVRNKTVKREYLQEVQLVAAGSTVIKYSGPDLRQDDALVWYQIIHMAKEKPLGETVEFSAYEFCKAIGWNICGKSYARLRSCLIRMKATSLTIYSGAHGEGVALSLIQSFKWKDENGNVLPHYMVSLPPELVALFGQHNYTQVEWYQRLQLSDGLASWLHGFYSSHKNPYDMLLGTLQKLSGSESEPRAFKRTMSKALDELKAVGFLKSWSITANKVHVERSYARTLVPMPLELAKQLGRLPEDMN